MSKNNLGRLRVLVVDDNHHMIEIIKLLLRGFGIREIFEARNAHAGYATFKSQRIDIVFTDFAMPPYNGRDLARRIRTAHDSPNKLVPIIMLSAYAERSNVEAAREAGVTEFCAKPVTASELYSKLSVVVNQQRPFVRTKDFFGPDRRRHREELMENERRAGLGPTKPEIAIEALDEDIDDAVDDAPDDMLDETPDTLEAALPIASEAA